MLSVLLPLKVPADFCRSQNNLSLLHALLPGKAYHDGSPFRLRLFDAVPCALIVITVLSWYSTVSLLDRRVRFDYPERASGKNRCKIGELRAVTKRNRCEVFVLPSFESGFLDESSGLGTTPQAALWASYCVLALQLLLDL